MKRDIVGGSFQWLGARLPRNGLARDSPATLKSCGLLEVLRSLRVSVVKISPGNVLYMHLAPFEGRIWVRGQWITRCGRWMGGCEGWICRWGVWRCVLVVPAMVSAGRRNQHAEARVVPLAWRPVGVTGSLAVAQVLVVWIGVVRGSRLGGWCRCRPVDVAGLRG